MVAKVIPVPAFDLVLFGATGDLAQRKIFPALFKRFVAGQMPQGSQIIGAARSNVTSEEFQQTVAKSLKEFLGKNVEKKDEFNQFIECIQYAAVDAFSDKGWDKLKSFVREDTVRAFYLSVAPSIFGEIAARLKKTGIATDESRIVVEKPFGTDLETAETLNAQLRASFEEKQIYRIDHYLGKETVQNLMALRFANALFEPLWNNKHIDHVQITVAEDIGVAGRGGYYDKSGAIRDMVQNHLMQLLCLTAMEPPSQFSSDAVRDEKLKVIRALKPVKEDNIVRGQYRASANDQSYIEHSENPNSRTDSYVAMKVDVANWRWAGTPFYLRTGKKLRERVSEIAVMFKNPPHSIFSDMEYHEGNALIIRLQPDEGITLWTTIKDPGPGGMRLKQVPLDMSFAETLEDETAVADAYERLIMDVIRGDQTLFMRGDEVEAAWAWIDPIILQWENSTARPAQYDAGGSGPEDALMLMHKDGRKWRPIGE